MRGRVLGALLLAAVVAACDVVGPGYGVERSELERARTRWETAGPRSYRVVQTRICFCPMEITTPVVITVTPQGVARAYQPTVAPVPDGMEMFFPTIPRLFDAIRTALDRGDHEVRATYDPATGAPREVYIDQDEAIADEEVRWQLAIPEPIAAF